MDPNEVVAPVVPETVPDVAAEEAATQEAFSAGFDSVNNDGVPLKEEPKPEPLAPAELEQIVKGEEFLPGYTKEQITALLARIGDIDTLRTGLDKVAGHVGNLVQETRAAKTAPVAKTIEIPKEFDVEGFDPQEFVNAYPEFALFAQRYAPKGSDVESIGAALQATKAELRAELEEVKIGLAHPDWEQTVTADGYKMWLATQAPEVQTLAGSPYAAELGRVLTGYKTFVAKATQAQSNKARLEKALVPDGVPGARPPEPTEEDAYRSGWAAVAGRK